MILKATGEITPELHVLGSNDLPAFLIKADRPVIIDAGMTCMAPVYISEVRKLLNGRSPNSLFLTHCHYDHCGAVPEIKKAFSGIQVCCAESGAEVLQRPRAIDTIRELNRAGAEYIGKFFEGTAVVPDFEPFTVDRTVEDGEFIYLGENLILQAIATPGHTRDSMSYYLPEKKILVTGEAVGIMEEGGYIYSEWLTSYDDYLASLKKLEALDVEILCLGHGLILTGEDASGYIPRSIRFCLSFRRLIETLLDRTDGDVEETKRQIKQAEYDPHPDPKQPEIAYLINLDAKIRAVQKLGICAISIHQADQ